MILSPKRAVGSLLKQIIQLYQEVIILCWLQHRGAKWVTKYKTNVGHVTILSWSPIIKFSFRFRSLTERSHRQCELKHYRASFPACLMTGWDGHTLTSFKIPSWLTSSWSSAWSSQNEDSALMTSQSTSESHLSVCAASEMICLVENVFSLHSDWRVFTFSGRLLQCGGLYWNRVWNSILLKSWSISG